MAAGAGDETDGGGLEGCAPPPPDVLPAPGAPPPPALPGDGAGRSAVVVVPGLPPGASAGAGARRVMASEGTVGAESRGARESGLSSAAPTESRATQAIATALP